ncbi:hypothetical protein AVEN_45871-1, partial [Araneus ventricosus]
GAPELATRRGLELGASSSVLLDCVPSGCEGRGNGRYGITCPTRSAAGRE